MYVLPKGLESAWIMARGKGYVFRTGEFGEGLVSNRFLLFEAAKSYFSLALRHRDGNGDGTCFHSFF